MTNTEPEFGSAEGISEVQRAFTEKPIEEQTDEELLRTLEDLRTRRGEKPKSVK